MPTTRGRSALPFLLLIVAALALACWSSTPPAAIGRDAPPVAFSAIRAMDVVRLVARAPHPAGSAQAAAVRAALAVRLRATGLSVETLRLVGTSVSRDGRDRSAGRVEVLVATVAGRDRSLPAIALMAHTDSVRGSFGAADDGAGVATLLETARAIVAGGRPLRDVMLILTDGEEAGLLGAQGYFADPARAARIGVLINVDSRGTSGLGAMFETGEGSGGLVALYRTRATDRFAHSAATFLYRLLPNRTDLTAAAGAHIPALNFAFLDGEYDYHTPRDRLASLDPRTLQSLGNQILPVVRGVADAAQLPPRGADGVFGDAPHIVALRYPAWVGWPLLAIAALLGGWAVRGAKAGRVLRAAAVILGMGIAAGLLGRLGFLLTGVGQDWAEHHRIMAGFGRYELALGLIGFGCVVGGSVLLLRSSDTRSARGGALVIGLLASLALQIAAPPLTPLLLWPTLAVALGAVLARRLAQGAWTTAAVALLPLAYILSFAHAVMLALGIPTPEAIGLFALVAALLLLPIVPRRAGWLAGAALLLAAGLLLSFRWTVADERHPILSQINMLVGPDGQAWRVSPLERPDAWTASALRYDGGRIGRMTFAAVGSDAMWAAPARIAPVTPPTIRAVGQGNARAVTVTPANAGNELRLTVTTDHALRQPGVEGVALPGFGAEPGAWRLRWTSPGRPVTLRFVQPVGARVTIVAAEYSERPFPLPPRDETVVPWLGSDRTIAISRAVLP